MIQCFMGLITTMKLLPSIFVKPETWGPTESWLNTFRFRQLGFHSLKNYSKTWSSSRYFLTPPIDLINSYSERNYDLLKGTGLLSSVLPSFSKLDNNDNNLQINTWDLCWFLLRSNYLLRRRASIHLLGTIKGLDFYGGLCPAHSI